MSTRARCSHARGLSQAIPGALSHGVLLPGPGRRVLWLQPSPILAELVVCFLICEIVSPVLLT